MKIPINWLKELVEIPNDVKVLTDKLTMVGHMLDKIEVTEGQTVLDLELRGNRADCYSILGIGREVAAITGTKIKSLHEIKLKQVKKLKIGLEIKSSLVKRAMITVIKNVKIEKSPKWLSQKLKLYGMESVNNIVDLTNYVMIEMGEPMHAFDLDKLSANLQIRLAKTGEKMITFQDNSITLTKDDLVWAMGKKVLSVAGAIGEKYHSISENTTNILLEAANYNRANIRKSVYRHNLLTEAGIRHEKDLDPNMVEGAIGRFLYLIQKYNWGEFNSEVYDYYPKKVKPWKVKIDIEQLRNLGGIDIERTEITKILKSLNFEILEFTKSFVEVLVPTYRTDVTLPEDLIEEILRIYGYDKIPVRTLSLEIPKSVTPDYIIQENKLRTDATSVGFDEIISLSFVKEKYHSENITLLNPPNPDLKYLRNSLLENLMDAGQKIINQRGELVQLFEIGKIYLPTNGKALSKYQELRKIGFLFSNLKSNSFVNFKSLLNSFFTKANIEIPDYQQEASRSRLTNTYELILSKEIIGYGGTINKFNYTEIDLEKILSLDKKYNVNLWPKFPPQIEDITFELPEKTYIGNIVNEIYKLQLPIYNLELKDVYKNSYTFNIQYQSKTKTLTDREVENFRNKIINLVKQKFNGVAKS